MPILLWKSWKLKKIWINITKCLLSPINISKKLDNMIFSPSKSNYFKICFNKFNKLIGKLMAKVNKETNSQMKKMIKLPIGMMINKTKIIKKKTKKMKNKMIIFFEPKINHSLLNFIIFAHYSNSNYLENFVFFTH